MTGTLQKERIIDRNFIASFLAMFSCCMIMYMQSTTMAEYSSEYAVTATIAGLVSGLFIFSGLFARFCVGPIMNRFGWKKICLITLALHVLNSCLYFFVGSIGTLLAARFIHGLTGGACSSAVITMGTSTLPKSRYAEANGYLMLSTTLAAGIGPYIGGFLYDHWGAYSTFIAGAVLAAIALISILFFDDSGKESRPECEKTRKKMPVQTCTGINRLIDLKAIPISICLLLIALPYSAVMSFYRLYATELDMTKEFSILFIVYSIVLIISRPVAGMIQDRYGDNPVCYSGYVLQGIGLFLIAWRPCLITVIICAVCCALGFGTLNASCNAIATRSVSRERRPQAVASIWICCDLGMGLGPMVMGAVSGISGYSMMYFIAAGITILAIPVYYFAWGRKN